MSRIELTLDGQEELGGVDSSYREGIQIIVDDDTENEEQLKFNADGKEFFMKKEDIKTLVRIFNIK